MKITIESTEAIAELYGVPVRLWKGETEAGIPVLCYVALISPQTHDEAVNAQFTRELREVDVIEVDVTEFDLRQRMQ